MMGMQINKSINGYANQNWVIRLKPREMGEQHERLNGRGFLNLGTEFLSVSATPRIPPFLYGKIMKT